MRHAEFNDPQLVSLYDAQVTWSRDDELFLSIVNETRASRVLDFGCGTGRLTLAMAAAGHKVTGVDPALASLDAARAKSGADHVTWIHGTSTALADASFDTAVMTNHVAQFFVSDTEWLKVLIDLRRALIPGGRLAFDSRDPAARRWEQWSRVDSPRCIVLPDGRAVRVWTDVNIVTGGVISYVLHYAFPEGEELLSWGDLRFRSEQELLSSLLDSGFTVDQIYGGWNREPVGHKDGEFIVIAHA